MDEAGARRIKAEAERRGFDPMTALAIWRAMVEDGENAIGRMPAAQVRREPPPAQTPASPAVSLPMTAPLPTARQDVALPARAPTPTYRPALALPETAPVPTPRDVAALPERAPVPTPSPMNRDPVLPDSAPAPMARPVDDVPLPTARPFYMPLPDEAPIPVARPADPASERVAEAHNHAAQPASMGAAADPGEWLRYANQGATRNLPLDDDLLTALSFVPELGLQMEVFSGGQPAKGSGLARIGSTRHDHGNAADVFFYKDGRQLNWANPDDLPIYEEIVRRGRQSGLTGFGAGPGYMREGSMHIGFGPESVWGAGGSSRNAPSWLRNAFYGASPQQVAAASASPAYRPRLPSFAPTPSPSPMQRIFSMFNGR